jgi:hypothetical protein
MTNAASPSAPPVQIVEFTDPACPVAFSAEPVRLRIAWLYGAGLAWRRTMVVLDDGSRPGAGPPPERVAASRRRLHAQYGMPLDPDAGASSAGTLHASRLVVAARLVAPEHELGLLRALRVHAMAGGSLDRGAVETLGAPVPAAVSAMDDALTTAALTADMAAARAVSPAGVALRRRLGGGGSRYSTPSYRYEAAGREFELVGIHPVEAHEAVVANLAPDLARREDPASALEVLAWAGVPLATAEVAAAMARPVEGTRAELREIARFTPAGLDGYWAAPVVTRS